MSTSLAEQLRRLAVPQSSALQRDKKRPSFLFDPKDAAAIPREKFYKIGLQGLEELKTRNASFSQFENTLFHETSKNYERSVQDAAANKKLDKDIRKFFLLLSPYFSLSCSHYALEWLINRFSVHEYNRNDFLMFILPYHETSGFVRALQVIPIKENDSFLWLKSLQKRGIHLNKKSLYNHAASNTLFLKEIGDYVLAAVKIHANPNCLSTLFNFYCMTFTGALEHAQIIQDTHVTQMLGPLLKGLKSDIPDFCAGTYIITARLLSKTTLSDKFLIKIMDNIMEINVPKLRTDATLLSVILYQTQTHFKVLSASAMKKLSQHLWMPQMLQLMKSQNHDITAFLEIVFKEGMQYAINGEDNGECRNFVNSLLDEIMLPDGFVSFLINSILEIYNPKRKNISEEAHAWMRDLTSSIERKYPSVFDSEVNRILKVVPDEPMTKHQKRFQKLIANTAGLQNNFELLQRLYHPVPSIRKESIKYLMKKYDTLKKRDQLFLKDAILDRLNDDNPVVVKEALNYSKKSIGSLIDNDTLIDILIRLLQKCQQFKDNWFYISKSVLNILCCIADNDDTLVFLSVLSFLLPVDAGELKTSKSVVGTKYFESLEIFNGLKETLSETRDHEEFASLILNGIENKLNIEKLIVSLQKINEENRNPLSMYLGNLLLCNSLPEKNSIEVTGLVLDILLSYLTMIKLKVVKTFRSVVDCLDVARENKFPLQGFLKIIETLLAKTGKPSINFDFGYSDSSSKFYMTILTILLKGCNDSKENVRHLYVSTLKKFLDHFNLNFYSKIKLFLNVAISNSKHIDALLQLRCLRIVNSLLKEDGHEDLLPFIAVQGTFIPYLLICFKSEHKEIRSSAFAIVETLLAELGTVNESYVYFLKNLASYKEEILLDPNQILVAMNNILETTNVQPFKLILNSMVGLVLEKTLPTYVRAGIGWLLLHNNSIEVYNKLSELCLELLSKNEIDDNSSFIFNAIEKLDSTIATKFELDSAVVKLFTSAFTNDSCKLKQNDVITTLSVEALSKIDRETFESFNQAVKTSFLNKIIVIGTFSQNSEVLASVNKIFKHINLDSNMITEHLIKMRDVRSSKIDEKKRKRRASVIPTVDVLDTPEWKSGVTVLEAIQDKKKIKNASLLLPVLFEVLKKCLDFDEQGNVEYPKQLLLSGILNVCHRIEPNENLSENTFNIELIVQCIRASQNPQTHHDALLLLAHTAHLVPKQVLHHIMAIFTFMGSSVLRHDDAYSFEILNRIVDTIIPILVANDSSKSIMNVLRVFVDAILDVPEHRRMALFKNLLEKTGAQDNLHVFLLLMFESHVLNSNVEKQKLKQESTDTRDLGVPKRLDIAADVSRLFSADVIISNCTKLMEFSKSLPTEKENIESQDLIIEMQHQTPKQYRHYKYVVVTFVSNLLSSKEFVYYVAGLSDEELVKLEPLYKDMIRVTLIYIQQLSKISDKSNNTTQAQYWKVMLHHTYDVLDSVNALLTPQMFLLVVRALATHDLLPVKRRAIELLNSKLQHDSVFFQNCKQNELHAMIPCLITTIREDPVSTEQEIVIQTALLSLKLFVKLLAADSADKFVHVLDFITGFIKSGKAEGNILASTVLCLAELCSQLRAHAISNLNKFMPSLVKLLKVHKQQEKPDLLLLSTVTAIEKIIDSLPLFLSPFMEKLFVELSKIRAKWADDVDPKLQPFVTKLTNIKEKIGISIPPRVLVPAVEGAYNKLIGNTCYGSVGALMDILTEKLKNIDNKEIQAVLPDLKSFFKNALQFRAENLAPLPETNAAEEHVVKSLVTFILKLSESAFRPLYYDLFGWAVRTEIKNERVITFYSLSSGIANSLKGLFTLFAGHILSNAALLLDSCNVVKQEEIYFDDEEKSILLLEYVLKTLHAIFMYGNQRFINKEKFDVLMQPIVDQLENTLGGEEVFIKRANELVVPTVVQFAVATGDDALWKQLNYQILLKMRHESVGVRLTALKCVLEISRRLREDFLTVIPETIPFLAELLEDEEEAVDKACQQTVQEMEKILGEPLQKYF